MCVQDVADNQIDTGDLMECLVQNKHQKEMNEKCSVGVTHFQLVSVSLSTPTAVLRSALLILDKTNRSAKEVLSLLDIRTHEQISVKSGAKLFQRTAHLETFLIILYH